MKPEQWQVVQIGRAIVDRVLQENEHRSGEIIAGIDGERFHTYDTHQLVLLLTDGNASAALQIAAMAHDTERFSVPGAGVGYAGDRKGPGYEAYKENHAQKSAAIMREKLANAHIANAIIERVAFLIAHHDDTIEELNRLGDPELETLVAADALSWLNFSAPNYFNGKETKGMVGLVDKMCFMLRKLPQKFWKYLPQIHLREARVLPYLRENAMRIASERGIPVPEFP